jgi:hypothetical protein
MEQNSDTRARRQHSTVPVDKGLSALKLICGLTGNIVRPGSTETPSRTVHHVGADLSAHPAESQRARRLFDHHGGERSAPEELI